jgi:hypothetical protein
MSHRLSDMVTTTVENRDQMTTEETTLQLQVQTTAPPASEIPKLDERLWHAWLEKNEKRDKVKLARRVKVIAILVVLLSLATLIQRVAG